MLPKLLIAFCLMAVCVVIHATGVASALRWVPPRGSSARKSWRWTLRFIRIAGWMILLHLAEITVWAAAYVRIHALPDMQSAVYFSAVTYTTTGYGDLVLPVEWHLLGGVEALTGILMCGWSTGFFFTVVSRMDAAQPDRDGS